MTLANNPCAVTVTGTGAQTVFNYGFVIPVGSGFELVLEDLTTGVQTVLSTSLYSISGQGQATGGTFTYPLIGSAIPSTQTLTLVRQMPYQQATNLGNQDGYYPQTVEAALDNIVMQIQQLKAITDRCIKQPVVDTVQLNELPAALLRENKALAFDSTGQITLT